MDSENKIKYFSKKGLDKSANICYNCSVSEFVDILREVKIYG